MGFPAFRLNVVILASAWVSVAAFAEVHELRVPWSCPRLASAGAGSALPASREVVFSFTYPEAALDWSQWRGMLDAAPADGPDYLICIQALETTLQAQIGDVCRSLGGGTPALGNSGVTPTVSDCLSQMSLLTDGLRRRNAEFNQAAFDRGASAPVAPMESVADIAGLGGLGPLGSGEAERKLRGTCSVSTDPTARALSLSSEFVEGRLPGVLSNASVSAECRRRILASYLDAGAQSFPRSSPPPEALRRFVAALRPLVPEEARGGYDALTECLATDADPLSTLRGLETEVRQANQCVAIAPGDARRLINHPDSGSGMPALYYLSRPASNRFVAEIPVRFTPEEQDAAFRSQATQCLSDYEGIMRGPGPPPESSRSNLELRLAEPPASADSPANTIAIGAPGARAMSSRWSGTMDCPTITHELLHLLGLVDEYQESMMGRHLDPATGTLLSGETGASAAYTEYDCRARGPADSVMSNHSMAVNRAIGSYSAVTCTCDGRSGASLDDCRSRLAALTPAAMGCPQMSSVAPGRISTAAVPPPSADVLASYESAPTGLSANGMSYSIRHHTAPTADLLRPAHFRAITQPGCSSANSLYYSCARASQVTSAGHLGGGCLRGLPTACSDPEAWLR